MKEIELYLDRRYLEISEKDSEGPPMVFFFFRDKESRSGFPIGFSKPVAVHLMEAFHGNIQIPMDALTLIQELLSYGAITLAKVVIFKVEEGFFFTNLHFMVSGEEKIESVNTAVALAAAIRCRAPIITPQDLFIQAIENDYAKEVAEQFMDMEDEEGTNS